MAQVTPIRTSEEKLSTIEIIDGQMIFVTDKKELYLDKGTERLPFAGGIYVAGTGVTITENELGQRVINANGGGSFDVEIKDGNWWINGEDTGVVAEGKTPTVIIDPETKEWVINGELTGVLAEADTIKQDDFQKMTELLESINEKIEQALEEGV